MHTYTSIYDFCMDLFREAGIRPHLLRTARMESIISAVAVREGISLLPEENFRLFQYRDIVSVPIDTPRTLSIGIAGKSRAGYHPPWPNSSVTPTDIYDNPEPCQYPAHLPCRYPAHLTFRCLSVYS